MQKCFYQTSFDLPAGATCICFFWIYRIYWTFTECFKSNILISDSIFIKIKPYPILTNGNSFHFNPRNNKKHLVYAWYCLCQPFLRINIPANTQRWFNVGICWNSVAMSVNVISTLIQHRFVNVDSSIKCNVETTLILGWL